MGDFFCLIKRRVGIFINAEYKARHPNDHHILYIDADNRLIWRATSYFKNSDRN